MAERIITGKTGEPHVTSLDERVLNGSLLGRNTLYKLPWGSNFDISITGELTAKVGTGIGVFQGIEFMIEDPIDLTFESLGPSVRREDLIIVEYKKNSVSGLESVEVKVKKGEETQSGIPQAPSLLQENIWDGDGTIYQQTIATITMKDSKIFGYMPSGVIVTDGYSSHIINKNNPHDVTKEQIGLELVDNTPDEDKEVKSARVSTKLKKPFKLAFDGDLQGAVSIDGSEDVILNTTLKGGASMPFFYKLWQASSDKNWRNFLHGLFPRWVDKYGTNREILGIITAEHTNISMYTAGNYCKIGIRLKLSKFSEDKMDELSLSALVIDPSLLYPIIMQYDTSISSTYLSLYNAKARLEYIYNCTLNYPKKYANMCSIKPLPCAFQALIFDSMGNPKTFQLTFDGTSFLSAKSVNDEWEPAIIAKKNGVTNPTYLYIELEFPCDAIGGSTGPANYIEIGATEVSTQNNTMYSGGVE